MFKKCLITIVVVISLIGCQPLAEVDTPTLESTATATKPAVSPTPTFSETPTATPTRTPSVTPTFVPTSTPVLNAQGYETVQDSRGHWMVRIPAGMFTMGLTDDQVGQLCALDSGDCQDAIRFDYTPHEVTLTNDYWIDVYEVSNGQYAECVRAGICDEPHGTKTREGTNYYLDMNYVDYPANTASWLSAINFCEVWRKHRLPTEAEWEYAARGNDGRLWPWGNTLPNEGLTNHIIPREWGRFDWFPSKVDSYPLAVSPFGVFNMGGNVFEFVQDWYGPYPTEPVTDPTGPRTGSERTLRGGRYSFDIIGASSAVRMSAKQKDHFELNSVGIRCASDGS